MLPPETLEAFAEELEKLASVKVVDDRKELEKLLKPGDILATKPKDEFLAKGALRHKLLRPLLTSFQGVDHTHVGLYVGDGRVVDAGEWRGKARVTSVPLSTYLNRYDLKVLRVNATSGEKKDAVGFAKEQVGKPFSLKKMIRLALPVSKNNKRAREEAESMFCSELVANAYATKGFGAGRLSKHVRPVDIQKSPLTKTVAVTDS